jgi:hypothetical protein
MMSVGIVVLCTLLAGAVVILLCIAAWSHINSSVVMITECEICQELNLFVDPVEFSKMHKNCHLDIQAPLKPDT